MDVFVDTLRLSFSIEVGLWDTVLTIKQKIEKSQGVPVSKQTLFFHGKILQDHLHLIQCHVLQNSRLLLTISPDDIPNQNNDQVPHQTKQCPAPTNQIEEFLNSQGWPVMLGSNNDQVLHTEKIQVSLDTINEFLGIQDSPVTVEGKNYHQTEQPPVASDSVGEIIDGQDSSVMLRSNYNESEELLGIQEHLPPVTVGSNSNTNKVKRPLASYSVKEIINIPDSPVKKKIKIGPMKMTVMVRPFKENRRIPVEVNERDKVEELRKELVKMQERGQINLPQERYIFIHKQDVLTEDQSFRWNLVANGDTIEIFQAYIVSGGPTTTIVRSFGH